MPWKGLLKRLFSMLKLDSAARSDLPKPANFSQNFKSFLKTFTGWPGWIWGVILLMALLNLSHLILKAFNLIQFDYSEGLVLSGVHRILDHPSLSDTYSFNPAFYDTTDLAYPPVFPYLGAFLSWILSYLPGFQSLCSLDISIYAVRGLTLLGLLSSGALIYATVRLFKASRLVSLAAAGLFFCFHPVIYWGDAGRVDALGLAFVLAGIYTVCRATPEQAVYSKSLAFLWALPFFYLAFFTKQSLVAAALAVVVYLFISGRKKHSVLFAGLLGMGIGLGLAVLAIATGGNYLFFMTMERFTPFSIGQMLTIWGLSLALYCPLVGLAIWQVPAFFKSGGIKRLLVIWGGFALLLSFTIGKAGAADYYFFEALSFLCIMAGHSFSPLSPMSFRGRIPKAVVVLQLLILFGLAFWLNFQTDMQANLRPAYQEASRVLAQYPGHARIFAELSGPAMASGHYDQVFDHFLYRQLSAANVRDGQALVRDVIQQKFEIMLMGYDVLKLDAQVGYIPSTPWPPGFEQAVQQHYRLLESIRGQDGQGYAWLLVPK